MTTNTLLSNIVAPTSIVTLGATQTLTNKTLTSPTLNSATINSSTLNNPTITGVITAGGGTGTTGQFLQSTGTGVQWANGGGGSGTLYVVTRALTYIQVPVSSGNLIVVGRTGNVLVPA